MKKKFCMYRKIKTRTSRVLKFYRHGAEVGVVVQYEASTGLLHFSGHWNYHAPIQPKTLSIFEFLSALKITPKTLAKLASKKRKKK